MTRFLKLVRQEDGKWKPITAGTDDLAQVSLKERLYAPIDPDQLLKALDSLLSKNGGIKSVEDVPRLARCTFVLCMEKVHLLSSCSQTKPVLYTVSLYFPARRNTLGQEYEK